MIRTSSLILIFLFTLNIFAQRSGYWQQEVAYTMHIKMDTENHQFDGKQNLVYTNNSPDTLDRVFYHLYFNAFQPGSMMDVRSREIEDPDYRVGSRIYALSPEEQGFQKITSLKQDGKKVNFEVVGTILEVELKKAILPGQSTVLDMDFKAQVPLQIRRSGRDNKEGIDYSMTQWYPKMVEYDQFGWHANPYVGREFHGVWGSFDVKITIDGSYTLGATGYLQNADEIGKGYSDKMSDEMNEEMLTWHFKAPLVHDFAWVADPDFTHTTANLENGTTLHFLYQKDSTTLYWDSLPSYAVQIFELMNAKFGEYPYEQYTVAQGGDGGMEYPMLTLLRGARSKGSLIGVTGHEAIHSWYQHLLATDEAQYSWMDEGFTSYAEDVILQDILKKFKPFTKSYQSYFNLVKSGKQEPLTTHSDHYQTNRAYSTASYSMGLIFLHQLSYIIGQEALDRGMLRYFNTWKYKHPTPNDFIRIMEKESGMELDWYLEQWIETTNTIDYGIKWMREEEDKAVIQLERIGRMPMPVDVLVKKKTGEELLYLIPLRIMRGAKLTDNGYSEIMVKEDWPWTHPFYELKLDFPIAEVESIEIDPSYRMADTDRKNNKYPFDTSKTYSPTD